MKKLITIILSTLMLLTVGIVNVSAEGHNDYVEGDQASITVGDSTVYYATLQEAIAAAQDNQIIQIIDNTDVGAEEVVIKNKTITIDLNGFNITGSNTWDVFAVSQNGNLTIKGTGNIVANCQKGFCFYLDKNSVLIVNMDDDAIISGTQFAVGLFNTSSITVNGGVLKGDIYAIVDNGSESPYTTTNVNGGVLEGTNGIGIYHPGGGPLTITDGVIKGLTGIYTKSGITSISGGKIIAYGDKSDYEYKGSGCKITGDALVIDSCDYPSGAPVVDITGGDFVSANAYAIASYCGNGIDTPVKEFITGGWFSSNYNDEWVNKDYINPDYKAIGDTTHDGCTHKIGYKGDVAQIVGSGPKNGEKYTNLQKALDDAEDGDTVFLLNDVEYEENGTGLFNITESITLDGNNHSISGYGTRSGNKTTLAINNGGSSNVDVILKNLTINNNGEDGRPIETRGHIESFTLNNVTINATGSGGNQGITIGGSQEEKATVLIKDSAIMSGDSGYSIIMFNPVDLTIDNSIVEGWTSLYFKGDVSSYGTAGSEVNVINNSQLGTFNYQSGATNGFSTIVFEDGDITVNIIDSELSAGARDSIATNHIMHVQLEDGYVSSEKDVLNISGNSKARLYGTSDSYFTMGIPLGSQEVRGSYEINISNGVFSHTLKEEWINDANSNTEHNTTGLNYTCIPNTNKSTNVKYPWTIGVKKEVTPTKEVVIPTNIDNGKVKNDKEQINNEITVIEAIKQDKAKIKASSVDLMPEAKQLSSDGTVLTKEVFEKAASETGFVNTSTDTLVVKVETYLDIDVKEADEEQGVEPLINSFKADITPMFVIRAERYNDDGVNIQLIETKIISTEKKIDVDRPVVLRMYLPSNFKSSIDATDDRVWVKHWLSAKESKVYGGSEGFEIKTDSTGRYIEFVNPDGFSDFEFFLEKVEPNIKPSRKTTRTYVAPVTGD